MITTAHVSYPVLIIGKHGIFGFHESPEKLIEKSAHLRWIADVDWLKLVDRDFNFYRMKKLEPVRGAGRFGGYFFEGPFLSRRVIYRAELQPLKKLSLDEVADLLLGFMREAQGFRKKDEPLLRQKFAEASGSLKTLGDVRQLFENLPWGDSSPDEDDEEDAGRA